jgi:hypothetical protein
MTLWRCFVCGSNRVCRHREPELVAWAVETGWNESQDHERPENSSSGLEMPVMAILERVAGVPYGDLGITSRPKPLS